MSPLEQVIQQLQLHLSGELIEKSAFEKFAKQFIADKRFTKFEPEMVYEAIQAQVMHGNELNVDRIHDMLDASRISLEAKFGTVDASAHLREAQRYSKPLKAAAGKPGNIASHFTDANINKALGLVAVGMSAFGALESAKHIVSKDEQGKDKINMTPLFWTLMQGAFAAGVGYLTFKQHQMTSSILR